MLALSVMSRLDLGGSVSVTVAAAGDDARLVLESLFEWLRHEEPLRGRIEFRPTTVAPDAMGAVDEVLTVALGAGGAGAVLARSLTEWLKHRTSDIRVTLTRPNGDTIAIDGRVRDPAKLIDTVRRFVDEHAPDGHETA